jgi:hypothetical protein
LVAVVNPAALLPHESPCPDCEDGKVPVVQVCTSSTAEEPTLATGRIEDCRRCDGVGIIVDEQRAAARDKDSPIYREFVELRNELSLRGALLDQQTATIRRLLEENRRLRAAVAKAARVIERSAPKETSMTASAQGSPHGADGRRRGEPVRSESTETTS